MHRSIMVSTDVYAAIWAARDPGENSEDEVLSRILFGRLETTPVASVEPKSSQSPVGSRTPEHTAVTDAIGFQDSRNGVVFQEGFRIFRDYKRRRYEAVATGGRWHRLDSGETFPSLNQLNGSIADGNENVWIGSWKYLDVIGKPRPISDLRK